MSERSIWATDFAHLVGKHIRMERPATRKERHSGEPPMVGMECHVAMVRDVKELKIAPAVEIFQGMRIENGQPVFPDKPIEDTQWRWGVEIVSDESIAFTVWDDEEDDWGFCIWPDADTAEEFDPGSDHAKR